MLRINSTTTRAVTAFDVVGLFCILLKCRPTASCRSCGARIIIRYVFTVKQKRCIPSKKNKQKKQPRKLSPARPLFNKMQGNHPLCPHSTHYPHFVKHFLPRFRTAPRSCSIPGMSTWQAPPAIWQKNGGKSCRINHLGARGKLSPARSPGQGLVFHLSSSRVR